MKIACRGKLPRCAQRLDATCRRLARPWQPGVAARGKIHDAKVKSPLRAPHPREDGARPGRRRHPRRRDHPAVRPAGDGRRVGRRGHLAPRPGRPARPGPPAAGPEAWEALQYALARLAIQFVSGPGALASALRRSLLGAPLNTKSVPLDIGHSATIPEPIRRAVTLRDKHCAWPGGLRRPPRQTQEGRRPHQRPGLRPFVQLPS
jgi:hypothetical protein